MNSPVDTFIRYRTLRRQPAVVRRWCVRLPNRPQFMVICVQGATADEMRSRWPGARVEPCDGR